MKLARKHVVTALDWLPDEIGESVLFHVNGRTEFELRIKRTSKSGFEIKWGKVGSFFDPMNDAVQIQ